MSFVDDLIDYLKAKCLEEPLLKELHCLLHADDTAILSTDRRLFIEKCNHMLDYFESNSLSLNLSKSGFIVINGKEEDKNDIELKNGFLANKKAATYLGVIISESGNIAYDVNLFIEEKQSNVIVKYPNFCRRKFLAPLDTKLNVLNCCVSSSLTYACETWGDSNFSNIEVLYRRGLKSALSVRPSLNNEIVYLETGEWPLKVRIVSQQLQFWLTLQQTVLNKIDHYITKLVRIAENEELPYIIYYKNLQREYNDKERCKQSIEQDFRTKFEEKIREKYNSDADSRLGSYLQMNPDLQKPMYDNIIEFERVIMTRYRTGSHNLRIETGRRQPKVERENRLCKCGLEVQTLKHCLLSCPLLDNERVTYNVQDVENGVKCIDFLVQMERILELKCT